MMIHRILNRPTQCVYQSDSQFYIYSIDISVYFPELHGRVAFSIQLNGNQFCEIVRLTYLKEKFKTNIMNNSLKFNLLYRSSFSPCFSLSSSFPYLFLSFPPSCNKIVQIFSGFRSINTQRNLLLPLPDNCIFQFTIWRLQDYLGLPFPPSSSFLGSEWYLDIEETRL